MDKLSIYTALIDSLVIMLTVLILGGIASLIRTFSIRTYTTSFSGNTAKFIDNKLTFIGVIHHELSHALLAILTGAKITSCKLFQIKDGALGHVDIRPRGPLPIRLLQQAMCGIAPILCGTITLYTLYCCIMEETEFSWVTALIVILAIQISYHMSMSKQDLKVASIGLIVIYILLFGITLYIKIDYEMYLGFITIILAIMCMNLLIALVVKLFSCFKR